MIEFGRLTVNEFSNCIIMPDAENPINILHPVYL